MFAFQTLHERPVDFEGIVGTALEVRKRRIAGAEIVHVYFDADLLQLGKHRLGRLLIVQAIALGNLQREVLRRDPAVLHDLLDPLRRVFRPEHTRGHSSPAANHR
jgi:hypothetical protein